MNNDLLRKVDNNFATMRPGLGTKRRQQTW